MRQYEMFELTFRGAEPEKPEISASFTVAFRLEGSACGDRSPDEWKAYGIVQGNVPQNEQTIEVQGFYAGDGVYQARFYPAAAGIYRWEATGIPGIKETLSGVESCSPAAQGRHGMVRTDGLHFRYEDGTPYLPFGTTVYAMIHQERALMETTWETLKTAPFNKVRFCVFPKHYCFNTNEPEYFAFERTAGGFDFERPCYPFWELLEENLEKLDELGIQADLILFHPYDCWGFKKMSRKQAMDYLGYLVRRLSAFPNVWWSLANEYDLMNDFEPNSWTEFSAFLGRNDVYRHLLSNHNFSAPWDFADPYTTHCCLQSSEAEKIPLYQKRYRKPVILDEMGYEGNIPYNWGNLHPFELVHRFWNAVCHGGYATHGETFMEKMDDDQILWWSKGGTLKGQSPRRIRFLREILESFPGIPSFYNPKRPDSFETREELRSLIGKKTPGIWDNDVMRTISKMEEEEFERILAILTPPVIHYEEKMFLKYFGEMCTIYGDIGLPEDKKYRLELIDIWKMTRTVAAENCSGRTEVVLPGKPGIALLAVQTA